MQVSHTRRGTLLIGSERLLHLATLTDAAKPGRYSLCRTSDSTQDSPKTVLYYNESSMSQPIRVADQGVVKKARKAFLEWHKSNCKDCVETSAQQWDYCQEAQEMLSQS